MNQINSITIKMNTENAAFCPCLHDEINRVIEEWISKGMPDGPLRDINGNKIGEVFCYD